MSLEFKVIWSGDRHVKILVWNEMRSTKCNREDKRFRFKPWHSMAQKLNREAEMSVKEWPVRGKERTIPEPK